MIARQINNLYGAIQNVMECGTASIQPTKYRYEFDLGPSGLELTRMLQKAAIHGKYAAESSGARPEGNTCWENAARKVRTTSDAAAPRVKLHTLPAPGFYDGVICFQ